MKFIKTLEFSSQEIDRSIVVKNNDPVQYRLLKKKDIEANGKTSYVDTLKRKIVEASNGLMNGFSLEDGFRLKKGSWRLYFYCPPHNGKNSVYFKNSDLKPNNALQLFWEVKCCACQAIIPRDHVANADIQPAPIAGQNDQPARNVQIRNQHLPQVRGIQGEQGDLKNRFEGLLTEVNVMLQRIFDECSTAEDQLTLANSKRLEATIKFADLYSNSFGLQNPQSNSQEGQLEQGSDDSNSNRRAQITSARAIAARAQRAEIARIEQEREAPIIEEEREAAIEEQQEAAMIEQEREVARLEEARVEETEADRNADRNTQAQNGRKGKITRGRRGRGAPPKSHNTRSIETFLTKK